MTGGQKKKTAGKGGKRQSLIWRYFFSCIALVFTNITILPDTGYKNNEKSYFFIIDARNFRVLSSLGDVNI